MLDIKSLINIMETAHLTDSQAESLQKVIYGIEDGSIIELSDMPCVGDEVYFIYISRNGENGPIETAQIFNANIVEICHKYSTKITQQKITEETKSIVFFVDQKGPIASRGSFDLSELNDTFFLNKENAIRAFHSKCGLTELHIDLAMHCVGMDNQNAVFNVRNGSRFYQPYRNRFYTSQDDTTWNMLFRCGFAERNVLEGTKVVYYLTSTGIEWLSIFTGINIKDYKE